MCEQGKQNIKALHFQTIVPSHTSNHVFFESFHITTCVYILTVVCGAGQEAVGDTCRHVVIYLQWCVGLDRRQLETPVSRVRRGRTSRVRGLRHVTRVLGVRPPPQRAPLSVWSPAGRGSTGTGARVGTALYTRTTPWMTRQNAQTVSNSTKQGALDLPVWMIVLVGFW